MKPSLSVKLCKTWDGKPLACVDLPGDGAELQPEQPRQLAAALLKIAADSEALPLGPRSYREQRREYALGHGESQAVRGFTPRQYTPDDPPRLRKDGESVAEYRTAMGWSAP